MKKVILSTLALLALVGCSAKKDNVEKPDEQVVVEEDKLGEFEENFEGEATLTAISYGDFNKKLEAKETFIVSFGYEDCPFCQALKPVFNQVVAKNQEKLPEVCYLDVIAENSETVDNSEEALNKFLENVYGVSETEFYVPTVIVVKDGEIVNKRTGVVDGYTPAEAMTLEQGTELYNIFEKMFEPVIVEVEINE